MTVTSDAGPLPERMPSVSLKRRFFLYDLGRDPSEFIRQLDVNGAKAKLKAEDTPIFYEVHICQPGHLEGFVFNGLADDLAQIFTGELLRICLGRESHALDESGAEPHGNEESGPMGVQCGRP